MTSINQYQWGYSWWWYWPWEELPSGAHTAVHWENPPIRTWRLIAGKLIYKPNKKWWYKSLKFLWHVPNSLLWKIPVFDKSTINGPFSIAMLNYQTVISFTINKQECQKVVLIFFIWKPIYLLMKRMINHWIFWGTLLSDIPNLYCSCRFDPMGKPASIGTQNRQLAQKCPEWRSNSMCFWKAAGTSFLCKSGNFRVFPRYVHLLII
jgi:hypothetical protein